MKTTKILMIILGLMIGFTSCKKGGVFCFKGNDNIITETRNLDGFDRVELQMSGNVYVTQGAEYEVKVEASDNLMSVIQTKVSNTTLKIDLKNGKCLRGNETINFYVTLPNISGLELSGSGLIWAQNKVQNESIELKISGSGDIKLDSLEVDNVDVRLSGSGDLILKGTDTLTNEKIDISGSGKVNAIDLVTKNADLKISGSGECTATVLNSMLVKISGSGNVRYRGTPSITTDITGSGNIYPY